MRISWTRSAKEFTEDRFANRDGSERVSPRRSRLRRWAWVVVILAPIVFLMVLVVRASPPWFPSQQIAVPRGPEFKPPSGFAERFSRVLQFPTVARPAPTEADLAPFDELRRFLESAYPAVHDHLKLEVLGGHTLLFRWPGTDAAVKPILLMSHLDVVPAENALEEGGAGQDDARHAWTHPPFSGAMADGFIWGRGALDVKCGVVGLLEATESLLLSGFHPVGDVYLAFGHDEETGGREGNRRVAEALGERGVRFRFVLDEGGGLTEGIIDGIDRPVAFVGIAEKGYATIRIAARTAGGHSSMPPRHTAVGVIAAMITRLESSPFPARIDGASAAMLNYLGPEMPWAQRIAIANRWITGGLLARQFGKSTSLNAVIRTTMATTIVRGGHTPNVLPDQAEAFVNVRLLPGDTSESALRRIETELKQLEVEMKQSGLDEVALTCSLETALSEPSRVSSVDSDGFRTLQRTIAEVYPDAVVAPGLSMVATDSRYFAPIATDIYRFLPLRVSSHDLERIHGIDERIGIDTYADLIRFLARLIENLSAPRTPASLSD